MPLPHFLRFASDATFAGLLGLGLLALSGLAVWGEKRRRERSDIDAVGLLPWRDIAALSSFAGLVLVAMAGVGLIKG